MANVLARLSKRVSAAGYYFGVELQKELKIPVGLINSSYGARRQRHGRGLSIFSVGRISANG